MDDVMYFSLPIWSLLETSHQWLVSFRITNYLVTGEDWDIPGTLWSRSSAACQRCSQTSEANLTPIDKTTASRKSAKNCICHHQIAEWSKLRPRPKDVQGPLSKWINFGMTTLLQTFGGWQGLGHQGVVTHQWGQSKWHGKDGPKRFFRSKTLTYTHLESTLRCLSPENAVQICPGHTHLWQEMSMEWIDIA